MIGPGMVAVIRVMAPRLKRFIPEVGPVKIDQPRDRAGSFKSCLLPPGRRRLAGLDDMIISLYASGMTVREIGHHLEATFGTQISHETISNITEAVQDEVAAWQTRPLEAFYPVMFLDAIQVKIKDQNRVTSRAAHIAIGVDLDGIKHVLGIWVQAAEGAKFWAGVCAELANRGVKDVLIVACGGLTGFPEAIAAALRPIYTAVNEDSARRRWMSSRKASGAKNIRPH